MAADESRHPRGVRERFAARGIPFTPQRQAVLDALAGRRDHPSADALFQAVAARLPGVSRTTVYRSLETLVRLGLVSRIAHPGAAVRYDPRTERHHHLICERCGQVEDLNSPDLDALPLPDSELRARGFHLRDFAVHLAGLCRDCAGTP